MKIFHIFAAVMCLVLMTSAAFAQEEFPYPQEDMPQPEDVTKIFDGLELYPPKVPQEEQAVILAAKSDAMNMLCGKETQMAVAYIKKFAEKGMDIEEVKRLEQVGISVLEERIKIVMADKTKCKDSNFLLERFKVMKELRAVSYLLAGIDPKTVPSAADFPEIEKLLSPEAQKAE